MRSDHDESTTVLEATDLQKTYGRRRVVDGVNLHVGKAEIVGLLGPNGAGKSTSFRMICGMIQPDRGRVYLDGRDVTDWPMFRRARDGHMGYLPQEPSVFKKLTVEQNISALLELLGMDRKQRKERTNELLEEFNITHIRKSRAAGLSGGERRRLEIARCLVSDPKIVMLDEPFAGIDPVTVQSIQGVITQLRDSGISVLITDHAAREILGTVDRCYVIYQGRVLIDGTPEEVKQHPKVREEYLGDMDGAARSKTVMEPMPEPSPVLDVPPESQRAPVPPPHFQRKRVLRRRSNVSDV
ncbi:Lipopolysaccharide export system ATP-binding protein LptB [Stieleria maiorica]|uniref:Lipopolysaccharide export system ATP-binding protein LptB n=1 Tax=Stieleria maiorica TaxID=2795974 RepID=A0A5B9MH76_9BACT|nr:LPS export ABC transporter ATP-binding protein [Stieleria maiorica]QEF99340.1 Lipopolysaccharide export system ATP-binding protein LptB [Stieleria maiorica]